MSRGSYYKDRLSADNLVQCYEIASPRIKRYLAAEIEFVAQNLQHADLVLELGCGYGRIMKSLSDRVSYIAGNDISKESLRLARTYMGTRQNYALFLMDASRMSFRSGIFDAVFCVQNGISAFGVNKKRLVTEAIRVTKNNGTILFSSYSPRIWGARLEWFREQSRCGLIGEIDEEKTGGGRIVCKDGFRANTVSVGQLIGLFRGNRLDAVVTEVDQSSVFCKAIKKQKDQRNRGKHI